MCYWMYRNKLRNLQTENNFLPTLLSYDTTAITSNLLSMVEKFKVYQSLENKTTSIHLLLCYLCYFMLFTFNWIELNWIMLNLIAQAAFLSVSDAAGCVIAPFDSSQEIQADPYCLLFVHTPLSKEWPLLHDIAFKNLKWLPYLITGIPSIICSSGENIFFSLLWTNGISCKGHSN